MNSQAQPTTTDAAIAQVARAMFDAENDGTGWTWDESSPTEKEGWRELAQAAIKAIAELSTETPATAHGEDCETCKGRGMVVHWEQIAEDDAIEHEYECPVCDGAGKAPGHVQHYIAALIERATKAEHLASEYARQAVMRGLTERFTPSPPTGGFVVVPREPTEAMFEAGFAACERQYAGEPLDDYVEKTRRVYDAMIAAAPAAQPSAKDGVRVPADKCSPHVWGPWHVVVRQCYVCRTEECGPSRPTTATGLVDGGITDEVVEAKAKAMFDEQKDALAMPWERQWIGTQGHWRRQARKQLAAIGREVVGNG